MTFKDLVDLRMSRLYIVLYHEERGRGVKVQVVLTAPDFPFPPSAD